MRQQKPIDKLVALVIGIIIWAVFIPVVYAIIMFAIEETPEMKEIYYLLFGAYVGFPITAIIAYIIYLLSKAGQSWGRGFLYFLTHHRRLLQRGHSLGFGLEVKF